MAEWGIAAWGEEDKTIQDGNYAGEKVLQDRATKVRMKNLELHYRKAKALDDMCIRPKRGEQWRIITEKQFNAFALILSVLAEGDIDELYLAIYRINEPTVQTLCEFLDAGKIKRARFIISSFFNQTKRPERWALQLREYCEEHRSTCEMAYLHNHSKVVAIRRGDEHYVMEGSGNMSDNARIEQYVYENNDETFAFHRQWMEELIEKTNHPDGVKK